MTRIEPQELHAALERGEAYVVDVRADGDVYASRERIPGDVRYSPLDVQRWYEDIPKDQHVVTYCTCPGEATAAQVAEFLQSKGYRVDTLRGGLEAWKAAGFPTDVSDLGEAHTA